MQENDFGKYLILIATISYSFAEVWEKLRLQNLSPVVAATGMLTINIIIMSPYAITNLLEEINSLNIYVIKYTTVFTLICSVFAYFLCF